jgi:hypothetical protein
MSSPKRAPTKPAATKPAGTKPAATKPKASSSARPVAPAKAKPEAAQSAANGPSTSSEATRIAREIERALASGKLDTLTPEALHALMGACCKTYAMRVEAGENLLPIPQRSTVSPTEVMVTASGLLRAANLAVFELGMWQSWTGR